MQAPQAARGGGWGRGRGRGADYRGGGRGNGSGRGTSDGTPTYIPLRALLRTSSGAGNRGRGGYGRGEGDDAGRGGRSRGRGRGGGAAHSSPVPLPTVEFSVPIIDIGINLAHRQFADDLLQVLERAKAARVYPLIITGTSLRASQAALRLARQHPGLLYATAGIHPHDAKSWTDTTEKELRELLAQPEVLAVGECGLDFDRNFSTPAQQEKVFEAQLRIARDVKKPLFLHERSAHAKFTEMLRAHMPHLPGGAIVHCFTGTAGEARAYVAMGAYIGITGWVCDPRRGDELRRALREGAVPANRLMIETDGPFLTPAPARGRNEPSLLPLVLAGVASAMQMSPAELAVATTANVRAMFRLPSP